VETHIGAPRQHHPRTVCHPTTGSGLTTVDVWLATGVTPSRSRQLFGGTQLDDRALTNFGGGEQGQWGGFEDQRNRPVLQRTSLKRDPPARIVGEVPAGRGDRLAQGAPG
jgi:hypothetical protein